jgi:hypothetical protein
MPSWTNRTRRLSQMAKVGAISAAFMLGVGGDRPRAGYSRNQRRLGAVSTNRHHPKRN